MDDSVGTYSQVANQKRVRAGYFGNPGRLQGANPSPPLVFVDGNPKMAETASGYDSPDEKMPVIDTWNQRRAK